MLKISYFHTNTNTERSAPQSPLISCVIDNTLLKTINQNAAFVVSRVQICAVWCQNVVKGLLSVVPGG